MGQETALINVLADLRDLGVVPSIGEALDSGIERVGEQLRAGVIDEK